MSMKRSLGTLALLAGVATMASPARAQETKGKFRFTIHGNYIEVSDEIRSNAANQTTEIDPTTGAIVFLSDTRDAGAEGKAATIRFRPTKAFAPYLGAGVGYYFVDFKQSSDVEELSANLQVSSGSYTVYDPRTFQTSFIVRRSGFRPVVVDAPDAFEYHLAGG